MKKLLEEYALLIGLIAITLFMMYFTLTLTFDA